MKTFYRTLAGGSVMLLTFLLCSLFTACEEEEEEEEYGPYIVVAETEYLIDATTVEKTIEFEAKKEWSASIEYLNGEETFEEMQWIQLKKSQGKAGKAEIVLELKPNYTEKSRFANINILIPTKGERETIHIEQVGSGDEKTKRVKAIYGTTYVNGNRDMWKRLEFKYGKYDKNGKLVQLYVGEGKINENGTLEGNCSHYIYVYQPEAITTTAALNASITYEGDCADMDLENMGVDEGAEVRVYDILLNENGDAIEMSNEQYSYDGRRLIRKTFADGRETEYGWDADNLVSIDSHRYSFSNHLNNYTIDLNRYMIYGQSLNSYIPSDCLGERSKYLISISDAQFDENGYLVSFVRYDSDMKTEQHIVYEEAE